MNKKYIKFITVLCVFLCLLTCGCNCNGTIEDIVDKEKPFTGIAAMFDEPLGYYNEHPSVFLDGENRYIYYTKNEKINDDSTEYIAVRKGTIVDNEWKYDEPAVALNKSQDGWDSKKVFQADVVKGEFQFDNKEYSYLMAYAGINSELSRKCAQIGLAVAESPQGPFIRVSEEPFILWNAKDYSYYGELSSDGICEPSLINYNGKSQIILFYSLFNPNTSFSCKYVLLDLSGDLKDLTPIKGERGNLLSRKGINDMSTDNACIGADFVLSEDKTSVYVVRDYYPVPTLSPSVAEAVQVLRAPIEILKEIVSENSPEWEIIDDKISALDTAVWDKEDMTGYDRIYSACIIGDAFGRISDVNRFSIAFTSCALAQTRSDYKYTSMIHEYIVK